MEGKKLTFSPHTPYSILHTRGVTLLDTIVGTALMLVVFLGIAGVFQLSVDVVTNNKARAGAIALANERMEYLKSLSYSQIGVIGGIPAGNVPQLETTELNAVTYTRRTIVFYSDDPQDGLGGADTNGIIADYKTIRVEISWQSQEGERSVTLVGRVSPVGVETAVPGGTLAIGVVNATAGPVSNAQVDIINTGTNPAINIRTYTDTGGTVNFIGAPAASDYQITVTKPGYSSAQTYPVTVPNPNPDPRHVTVSNNQTTSATFAIDLVSQKTVETYKAIETRTWSDTFADDSKVATTSNIAISGGAAQFAGAPPSYEPLGTMRSTDITTSYLAAWKALSWVDTTPPGTDIVYQIYDSSSSLIPDSSLPGNTAGFSTSPINLSGISTTTYPTLRIGTTFTTNSGSVTPSLDTLTLAYEYGPEPLPNFQFTMRGAKTIGNSPTVYKYDATHTTDASARITLSTIEWDTYRLGIPTGGSYDIAEACAPQAEALAPNIAQSTRLYLASNTTHSLLVDVRTNTGTLITGASVQLSKTGYDVTQTSSGCGQTFFSNLTNGMYTITVSKVGYQQYTNANVSVSGDTQLSVVLQNQ